MYEDTNIIVPPEEIWDFFIENKKKLSDTMMLVAENNELGTDIYMTETDGTLTLVIDSVNVNTEEFPIKKRDDAVVVTSNVYELYLTDKILTVMSEEDEDAREYAISEQEDNLTMLTTDYLENILGSDPVIFMDNFSDIIEDCKEHFLEYMHRKHKLNIYRPMILEDEKGETFFEEYPYDCMVFEDKNNPIYK